MNSYFQLESKTEISDRWELHNRIPGSKYLANRLLILAALSEKAGELKNVPKNDDIQNLYNALKQLGYPLTWQGNSISFAGISHRVQPEKSLTIDCGASGTMARFICALVALDNIEVTVTGSKRLQQRPMQPLFDALTSLGVETTCSKEPGCLPVKLKGPVSKVQSDPEISLPGNISSQYISALLLIGALIPTGINIRIQPPLVSSTYIQMTLELLQRAHVAVSCTEDLLSIQVEPSTIRVNSQALDADPCSASYIMAAAILSGNELILEPYQYQPRLQGEYAMIDVLREMGCDIQVHQRKLHLKALGKKLIAVKKDMGKMPDIVQTLAIIACFADGVSRFENIAHLKVKESDRISDTVNELKKCGVEVRCGNDWMEVTGRPSGDKLLPCLIDSHHDHRMAMSFAQMAWKLPRLCIDDPMVVNKSFPDFWGVMQNLGMKITKENDSEKESDNVR